jgi:lipooligosaccharide transport system permease protein
LTLTRAFRFPNLSWRFIPIWRRHFLVWRKLAIPSILGHLADPAFYMLGLGYGLGNLLPDVGGVSYLTFLAAGTLCHSTMNCATFESMYSAFSRMHVQKTWDAMLNAPLMIDDILLGELIWATSKSLLSGVAILVIILFLGIAHSWLLLGTLPLLVLIGFCFAGLALVVTALSPNFDFFMYYSTLVITPMVLLCGVFFPLEQLPGFLQSVAHALPLTHAIALARPLVQGDWPQYLVLHIAALFGYGCAGFYLALVLVRRRLLK